MGIGAMLNLPIEEVPERFVEVVVKLKLQQREVRKTMLKIIHNFFQSDVESDKAIMEICEYMCFLNDDSYSSLFFYLIGNVNDVDPKELNLISALFEIINCCVRQKFALPDIENNDFIAQKESCHKKFGNGKTILAIDAMEALVFQVIYTDSKFFSDRQKNRIIEIINNYRGKDGVCGGQIMKMLCKKKKVYKDELTRIKQMLFNAYFLAFIDCLNVVSSHTQRQKNILKSYANNVCNLLCLLNYDEIFIDNAISDNTLQKARLFADQGVKIIENVKNRELMQNFIEYLYYNIEKKCHCNQRNSPMIVESSAATL